MRRFYIRCIAVFVAILLLQPTPALANAGTSLTFVLTGHLVLGNLAIGIVEGVMLHHWFKISRRGSILLLIAANYVSTWVGLYGLQVSSYALAKYNPNLIFSLTLQNVGWFLMAMVVMTFLMTLVLEYPFFLWLLRRQLRPLSQAFKATLIVHSISYLLLFGLYRLASPMSFLTQLEFVEAAEIQPAEDYNLYWISPEGNQVMRGDLLGREQEVVTTGVEKGGILEACPAASENHLNLLLNDQVIVENFAGVAALELPDDESLESYSRRDPCDYSNRYEYAVRLTQNSSWIYRTKFWAAEGIYGWSDQEKKSVRFALEAPFAVWHVRHLTHLEGDRLVFQLSQDQIYLLDPHERKIALVARGTSPLVVIPKS